MTQPLTDAEILKALDHIDQWKADNKAAGGQLKHTQGRRFLASFSLTAALWLKKADRVRAALQELDDLAIEMKGATQ